MRAWVIGFALMLVSESSRAGVYEVPLFFSADNRTHISFLDLKRDFVSINLTRVDAFFGRTPPPQQITITGYDDEGTEYGPIHLDPPEEHGFRGVQWPILYSRDIENGNVTKGLIGGLGDGVGNWRLVLTANDNYLQVQSYAGSLTGSVFAPMNELARSYRSNSGTTHIVPLLTHPNDIARMGIVRIFNRKDHYVRVQLITQRFGNGAWCDIPPYAVLTKDGTEIYDLLYNKYGPPGEGQNMDLEVRAV